MQRFPITKYFGIMSVCWGAVVACHAAVSFRISLSYLARTKRIYLEQCHSFEGLATVRFLLGFLEVCTAPVTIYLTVGIWPRHQREIGTVVTGT